MRKLLKESTSKISTALDETRDLISNANQEAVDKVASTYNSAKNSAIKQIAITDDAIQTKADSIELSVKSAATTTGVVAGSVATLGIGTAISYATFTAMGLSLGALTLPACALLVLADSALLSSLMVTGKIDYMEREKRRLKLARCMRSLIKYNFIKEDTRFESDKVSIFINAETGEISGSILRGYNEGTNLCDIPNDELRSMAEHEATDEDTAKLISLYLNLNEKGNTA
ncbi:hypothetical protein VCHA53O466_40376 [Vibrio chagasii]|nr:hypothetical protein VCHA53O466_40376 [Vibrio chagasii]